MDILQRLAREPLVHFLGIGALVFALHGAGATAPAAPAGTVITVAPAQVERLTAQFEAAWRRSPSREEFAALIEDHVREEIYYREALALGLRSGRHADPKAVAAEDGVPRRERRVGARP
jgi:hypothetical protein